MCLGESANHRKYWFPMRIEKYYWLDNPFLRKALNYISIKISPTVPAGRKLRHFKLSYVKRRLLVISS